MVLHKTNSKTAAKRNQNGMTAGKAPETSAQSVAAVA